MVHDHLGLLGGLAAAFSIGCRSLRRAEDFFADLGLGSRARSCSTAGPRATPRCAASWPSTLVAQVTELTAAVT